MLSVVVLLVILAGSIATSNGATSSGQDPQATTADGIDQPVSLPQSVVGPQGKTGPRGKRGPRGPRGKTGARGRTGPQGDTGANGSTGAQGTAGTPGTPGAPGAVGATGAAGPPGLGQFAEFFALMPPDNVATVAPGATVEFPQDGPADGSINRTWVDTFNLPDVGTYRIAFSVSVNEAGQLQLTLNGIPLAYTVVGRATGTTPIAGEALVTTTSPNSIISVINPAGSSTALTITPLAGGVQPVAATLIIQRLN